MLEASSGGRLVCEAVGGAMLEASSGGRLVCEAVGGVMCRVGGPCGRRHVPCPCPVGGGEQTVLEVCEHGSHAQNDALADSHSSAGKSSRFTNRLCDRAALRSLCTSAVASAPPVVSVLLCASASTLRKLDALTSVPSSLGGATSSGPDGWRRGAPAGIMNDEAFHSCLLGLEARQ
jgi:hypothetical protein